MDTLIIAPHFRPALKAGGACRTLEAMIDQSRSVDHVAMIAGAKDLDGRALPVPLNTWTHDRSGLRILYAHSVAAYWHIFRTIFVEKPRTVYFNSIFNPVFGATTALVADRLSRSRIVIAPRGQLHAGALRNGSQHKHLMVRVLRTLFSPRLVFHASTHLEAEHIRQYFPRKPIHVKEDETQLPIQARPSHVEDAHSLLFLGRLAPQKGLHVLLEAMAHCNTPINLQVVGDFASADYRDECLHLASLSDHHQISFLPAVAPDSVDRHFSSAGALILPTAGENFGHVIAEALSNSCPVLVTDTTPWTKYLPKNWLIPRDPVLLAANLELWVTAQSRAVAARRELAASTYDAWAQSRSGTTFLDEMEMT